MEAGGLEPPSVSSRPVALHAERRLLSYPTSTRRAGRVGRVWKNFNAPARDGLCAILFYMTIAKHWFTGIPEAIASGFIKLLERIYRRWQL